MVHYHIRWSDSKVDWQVFNAPEEAQLEAEELVRPGETYTIEAFEDDCPKCASGLGGIMTVPKFDIFRGSFGNPDATWLECVAGLAAAKQRMDEIAGEKQGQYFLFYSPRRTVLASTDTTKSASDSQKHLKAS